MCEAATSCSPQSLWGGPCTPLQPQSNPRLIAAPRALQPTFSVEKKLHTLDRLAWSENFESFLANKYAAAKRFGLEGCETLIPGMKFMIDQAADQGVEQICFGMPHRGEPKWWGY